MFYIHGEILESEKLINSDFNKFWNCGYKVYTT